MTKDHIVPRSRGGSEELSNMQPMCMKCNGKKDNRLESELVGVSFTDGSRKPPKERKYHVFDQNNQAVRKLNLKNLLKYVAHAKLMGRTGLTIKNMETNQTLPMDQITELDTIYQL